PPSDLMEKGQLSKMAKVWPQMTKQSVYQASVSEIMKRLKALHAEGCSESATTAERKKIATKYASYKKLYALYTTAAEKQIKNDLNTPLTSTLLLQMDNKFTASE